MTNTEPTVSIHIRDVYGKPTAYPACPTAEKFAALTGTKTLTSRDLKVIQSLGYTLVVKQRELA